MFVVPSRGRPQNIRRLAALTTGACFLLMLDECDPAKGSYADLPSNWDVRVHRRGSLSEIYNRAFQEFSEENYYGVFADDVVPKTEFWEHKLIAAAGDDGMAYGDDGVQLPTHFVLGGALVRSMGWLALPGLERLYIDTVWAQIAQDRGVLRYLPDVKITHRHPAHGTAMMDPTYRKSKQADDKHLSAEFLAHYRHQGSTS